MASPLTFGSLFAGIGGIDLGLGRAGMTVRWQIENDPWCQRVLAKHWPDVKRYGDIREVDANALERVDLIAGGFPCQSVSLAGKRLGQADERWLWPEFARVVRAVRPRYVLVENVPGLLTGGIGDVLGDLAACGFDAEWQSLPAAAFGAPHIRERVWIVAYDSSFRCGTQRPKPERQERQPAIVDGDPSISDADCGRLEIGAQLDSESKEYPANGNTQGRHVNGCGEQVAHASRGGRCNGATEDGGGSDDSGWSQEQVRGRSSVFRECPMWRDWDSESGIRRVANGFPRRVDRLRGLGNAVVPQVVEWIGRRIIEAHHA